MTRRVLVDEPVEDVAGLLARAQRLGGLAQRREGQADLEMAPAQAAVVIGDAGLGRRSAARRASCPARSGASASSAAGGSASRSRAPSWLQVQARSARNSRSAVAVGVERLEDGDRLPVRVEGRRRAGPSAGPAGRGW